MAILAHWLHDVTDDDGNLLTNVQVRIERESDAGLPSLYDDRNSATANALGNPYTDADGMIDVYLTAGNYKVTLTAPGHSPRVLRNVQIGIYADGASSIIGGSTGSTDNRLLRADGTGGATAQGSAVTVDDSGNMTGVNDLTVGGAGRFDGSFGVGRTGLALGGIYFNRATDNPFLLMSYGATPVDIGQFRASGANNVIGITGPTGSPYLVACNVVSSTVAIGKVTSAVTLDVEGPVRVKSYTVATVPSAAAAAGQIIYVSNEAGGGTIAFSDGTNWRRVADRAVIS